MLMATFVSERFWPCINTPNHPDTAFVINSVRKFYLNFQTKYSFTNIFFKTYGLKNPGDRCEFNIFGAEEPRFDIKNLWATERKCNIKNP